MGRARFFCSTIFVVVVASMIASAASDSRSPGIGIAKITVDNLESGSASVRVTAAKIKGTGVLIRIISETETPTCDPYAPMTRQLDFRDAYTAERDMQSSVSGAWSISDVAEDGARAYESVLSPSRLRQQFFYQEYDAAAVGAVTGGAVGAVAYVCVYRRAGDASSSAVEIIDDDAVSFVSKNSADAPLVDVRAYVASPVKKSTLSDGRTIVEFAIETRSFAAVGCADTSVGVPALEHVHTSKREGSFDDDGYKQMIRVAGENVEDAALPQPPVSQKRNFGGDACDALFVGTDDCLQCSQFVAVAVPLTEDEASGKVPAIQVVSKFEYVGPEIVARDAYDDADGTIPGVTGRDFLVRFVVPLPSRDYDARTVAPIEGNADALKKMARVVADVYSDDVRTTTTRRAKSRSVGESPTEISTAAIYDGKVACVVLTVDGLSIEANADRIMIASADATYCPREQRREDGTCSIDRQTVNLVEGGRLNDEVARFAGGRLTVGDGETELCFVPDLGLGICDMEIEWVARSAGAVDSPRGAIEEEEGSPRQDTRYVMNGRNAPREGPPPPPPHDDDDHHDHPPPHGEPDWCEQFDECTGIVIIQSTVTCGMSQMYDPVVGHCIGHEMHGARHTAGWLFFPVLLLIGLVVFVGFVLFLGYNEDSEVRHHQQ